MKSEKRKIKYLTAKFFIFSFSLFIFVGCKNHYLLKGMSDTYLKFRNDAGIDRYHIFKNRYVATGTPQPWRIAKNYDKSIIPDTSAAFLKKTGTIAYLIIKNDSIYYEKYFEGFSDTSHTNSWSMAKSITSLLIGAAIEEGKIKSVDEKVSDFLPSFNKGLDTLLKIKDLLTMSSGIPFGESYVNPAGYPAKALYGSNITWLTLRYHCTEKPGTKFIYQSGNTELLGHILTKATGKTVSEYASEKLWKPLGAEYPAFWSTDHKDGMEKTFCCFNSNARDFARIGMMMLDSGKWNGKEIIPKDYFIQSTTPQTIRYYGYQWWIGRMGTHKLFWAEGYDGQFIIVIPDEKMVVVRLGKRNANGDGDMYVGTALEMYGK